MKNELLTLMKITLLAPLTKKWPRKYYVLAGPFFPKVIGETLPSQFFL
jgi:hypothetical protein